MGQENYCENCVCTKLMVFIQLRACIVYCGIVHGETQTYDVHIARNFCLAVPKIQSCISFCIRVKVKRSQNITRLYDTHLIC